MCVIVGTFVLVATAPPSAPQNLHVDSAGRDHFTLSWDTPKETGGGPVKHYIIEMYSLDDPEFIEKFQVDGSVTSYTASGLQQNWKRLHAERRRGERHGCVRDSRRTRQPGPGWCVPYPCFIICKEESRVCS